MENNQEQKNTETNKEEETRELKISLMPDKILVTPKIFRQKLFIFIIILLISLVFIFSLYLLIINLGNKRLKETKDFRLEIEKTKKEVSGYATIFNQVKNLEERVDLSDKILSGHIYWTKLFSFLEQNTLKGVSYYDFSNNFGDKITLFATAKDVSTFLKQMSLFQNLSKFLKEAKFSSFKFIEGEDKKKEKVEFRVELFLKEDFFLNN